MSGGISHLFFILIQTLVFSHGQDLTIPSGNELLGFFPCLFVPFLHIRQLLFSFRLISCILQFLKADFFAYIVMVLIQKMNGVGSASSLQYFYPP